MTNPTTDVYRANADAIRKDVARHKWTISTDLNGNTYVIDETDAGSRVVAEIVDDNYAALEPMLTQYVPELLREIDHLRGLILHRIATGTDGEAK